MVVRPGGEEGGPVRPVADSSPNCRRCRRKVAHHSRNVAMSPDSRHACGDRSEGAAGRASPMGRRPGGVGDQVLWGACRPSATEAARAVPAARQVRHKRAGWSEAVGRATTCRREVRSDQVGGQPRGFLPGSPSHGRTDDGVREQPRIDAPSSAVPNVASPRLRETRTDAGLRNRDLTPVVAVAQRIGSIGSGGYGADPGGQAPWTPFLVGVADGRASVG